MLLPANLVPWNKNREQTHHTVPRSFATLKTLKIEQKTDEGNLSCYKLTQIPELRSKDQVPMGRLKSRNTPLQTPDQVFIEKEFYERSPGYKTGTLYSLPR